MVPTKITIRRQYIRIYLLILVTVGFASAFSLYMQYADWVRVTKSDLLHNAHTTTTAIDGVLADATKLLDIDKAEITKGINSGTLTDEAAHQILSNSKNVFSTFISNESLLLTLYIDENGLVRATTNGASKTHVGLSDRFYFQALKNNPQLSIAIGSLVNARTTGTLTFHIALPIIDKAGKFRGIIAQQVLVSDLIETLDDSLDSDTPSLILTHLTGGNVAFVYPNPTIQTQADIRRNLYINEKIISNGHNSNLIEIPKSPALPETSYVGYASSHAYGYMVSASISKSKILLAFIHQYAALIVYCLVAFVVLSIGMFRFYKKAIRLSSTLVMSFTDGLTKIKNRRAFDTEFPRLWKNAIRSNEPISALFIDIDHFKSFNDEHGHECGDIALVAVAKVISKCVSRPLDFCCRWGGEEFVVVLPETDERGATLLAREILTKVRSIKLNFPCEHPPKVTVSIGIASMIVTNENQTDDLVDMADKAMYFAKQSGRDKYILFNELLPSP